MKLYLKVNSIWEGGGGTGSPGDRGSDYGGGGGGGGRDKDWAAINKEIDAATGNMAYGGDSGNGNFDANMIDAMQAEIDEEFRSLDARVDTLLATGKSREEATNTFLGWIGNGIGYLTSKIPFVGEILAPEAAAFVKRNLQKIGVKKTDAEIYAAAYKDIIANTDPNTGLQLETLRDNITKDIMGSVSGNNTGNQQNRSVIRGVGDPGTDPIDPSSMEDYDFWSDYVDEFTGLKGYIAEDDAYRKSKVEPAIGKYQSLLSDLSNQATTGTGVYTPNKWGIGDYKGTRTPNSAFKLASDLESYGKKDLASALALTDVMQPNRGNREYLDKLEDVARWKYGLDKQIASQDLRTTYEPDDRGTWLDTIKDIFSIGDVVNDDFKRWIEKNT